MRYRPDRDKEIAHLKLELAAIAELKATIETKGWRQVVAVFQKYASQFAQDVYNKCDKPEENAIEIRCKKWLVDTLGAILVTLDARVSDEDYVRKQLVEKMEVQAHSIDLQNLNRL
jgi:hypothetical protein